MANRKITDLTALTAPAADDVIPIVDVSETSNSTKNKKITYGELSQSLPDGSNTAPAVAFNSSASTGLYRSAANELSIATNGAQAIKVEANNNTTIYGTVTCTSLTETSDVALKTNIEPITDVLDKINQITGYKYDFTKSNSSSMGVIAQDVEKVFPELVHGEEGSKSLQYSGLIGALIESVKELSAKVTALENA